MRFASGAESTAVAGGVARAGIATTTLAIVASKVMTVLESIVIGCLIFLK